MRAIRAVGPIVISLQLPNTTYTKQPTKAEYKPYWKKGTTMLSHVFCLVQPSNNTFQRCFCSILYISLGLIFVCLLEIQIYCCKANGIKDIVVCLLKARTVRPAETAVARERLCKHAHCWAMAKETNKTAVKRVGGWCDMATSFQGCDQGNRGSSTVGRCNQGAHWRSWVRTLVGVW
jgi:hypothetical protein